MVQSDGPESDAMNFTGKTAICAGQVEAFGAFTDFDATAELARASGAEIRRLDDLAPDAEGARWQVEFDLRGTPRTGELQLVEVVAPEKLRFKSRTDGFDADIVLEFVRISPVETRALITAEVAATKLKTRLLLQTAHFAKARLDRSFRKGWRRIGRTIEARLVAT